MSLPLESAISDACGIVRAELDLVAARVSALASSAADPLGLAAGTLASRRGKLIRPALVLLSARAAGPKGPDPLSRDGPVRDRLLAAASAFELLHLASLTHDDVLDASTARRGWASTWVTWGVGVAILAGDHLFGKAVSQAAHAGPRALRSLCRTIDALLAGQAAEMSAVGSPLGRRAYLSLATAKTAVFSSECCAVGAGIGGAGSAAAAGLRRYGRALGQAYQLVDDLLDWTGDPSRMGKPGLSDLVAGRLTYPVIAGLARRPRRVGRCLEGLRECRSEERPGLLERLAYELDQCGALAETLECAAARTERAVACLEVLPEGLARRGLESLALSLVSREC